MYENLKRTCRAIGFAYKAFCFVARSLSSPLCFRKVPIVMKDSQEKTLAIIDVAVLSEYNTSVKVVVRVVVKLQRS